MFLLLLYIVLRLFYREGPGFKGSNIFQGGPTFFPGGLLIPMESWKPIYRTVLSLDLCMLMMYFLFELILFVPVNNFQLCLDKSSQVEPVARFTKQGLMCLARTQQRDPSNLQPLVSSQALYHYLPAIDIDVLKALLISTCWGSFEPVTVNPDKKTSL